MGARCSLYAVPLEQFGAVDHVFEGFVHGMPCSGPLASAPGPTSPEASRSVPERTDVEVPVGVRRAIVEDEERTVELLSLQHQERLASLPLLSLRACSPAMHRGRLWCACERGVRVLLRWA